jgi:hypothetical protein
MSHGLGQFVAAFGIAEVGQRLRRAEAHQRMRALETFFQDRFAVLSQRFQSQRGDDGMGWI